MKILDSDHCIAILRGVLDLLDKSNPDDELAITSISVGELSRGAYRSQRPVNNLARLDVLLSTLTVLPYDESSALRFGIIKTELERAGTPLHDLDLQIASIALENNTPLLTHNEKHFSRIDGLIIEDWIA
jgi:tRNA(fMet)-specific endonuclease VapC